MDKHDRHKNIVFFLTGVFLVGITLGSIMGLGSTAELGPVDGKAFRSYVTSAALTGIPFWCAVFLPCTFRHRLGFGSLALLIKGVLLGCSGVMLLSGEGGAWRYCLNILPQLLSMAPLYIFIAAALLEKEDRSYTYPSILTNFFLALLTTFMSSCVQYLFFWGINTIQVIFMTNF